MDAGARLLEEYKKFIGVYEPDDILRFRQGNDLRQAAWTNFPSVKDDLVVVVEKLGGNRYTVAGERPTYQRQEDKFVTFEIDGRDWENVG